LKATAAATDHFGDLDGMRGVLAFTVMLYHYGLNSIMERIIGYGGMPWGLCVDFFFVLSGFVICRSVFNRPTTSAAFAIKRFWRLFPLHVAILLAFAPVLFAGSLTLWGVLINATAIAPLLNLPMVNGPAWSMGFEFYLPILFVAVLPFVPRSGAVPLLLFGGFLVAMSLTLMAYTLDIPIAGTAEFNWLRATTGLGLGFWLWMVVADRANLGDIRFKGLTYLGLSAAFLLSIILAPKIPIIGLFIPVVIVAALIIGMRTKTVLSWWPLYWLGRLSFGVYMVHIPVLLLFSAAFGAEALDGNLVLKSGMIVFSLFAAFLLHVFVELPGMRLGKHLSSKKAWSREVAH